MTTIRIRWRAGAPQSAVFYIPSSLLVEGPQALRPGDVATVRDAPLWRQELRPSDPGLELADDQVEAELPPAPELEPTPADLPPAPAPELPAIAAAPAALPLVPPPELETIDTGPGPGAVGSGAGGSDR